MNKISVTYFAVLFFISVAGSGQAVKTDSLSRILETAKEDTVKVDILLSLSRNFFLTQPDEALKYAGIAKELAARSGYKKGEAYALKNIGLTYYYQGKYLETINNWQQSLLIFEEIGDKLGVSNLLNNLGAVNNNEGDDTRALELYLKSLKVSEEIDDSLRIATALMNIGLVYQKKPNTRDKALDYYLRAISISEEIGDKDAIGTASMNAGEIYHELGDDTTALRYFERSLEVLKHSGNIFYPLNNIGKVYAGRGDFERAIKYQKEAYEGAKKVDAKLDMSRSLLGLADTYMKEKNYRLALNAFNEAKSIAEELGSNYELRDSYKGLANSFAELTDYKNAFKYQQLLTGIKDTLFNIANEKKIGLIQLNYDIEKKQTEIDLLTKDKELQELAIQKQKITTRAVSGGLLLIIIIALIIYRNYRAKVKTNIILDKQKVQIENLLLNILPQKVASELQQKGQATPRYYESVSVLFTDFKGFTMIAESLSPQDLVTELNEVFFAIDDIIERYNLEKIKTIGDSYMCAGGIPTENENHPVNIVKAGLEIRDHILMENKKRRENGQFIWDLRLGIHTGPVVAGVVGRKKYAYDIWGNTVNIASRMESSGEPGKVNISADTYNLIKDNFHCMYRGRISAKNIGEIDMYFVEKEVEACVTV